jgi:hypothetical protein
MRTSPSAVVVVGLGLLAYLLLFPAFIWGTQGRLSADALGDILKIDPRVLLLVAIVGALGSVVSIMMRIRVYAYTRTPDPWPFLFFGLFKPIVGAVFALFLVAALQAALIPGFQQPKGVEPEWFFVTVAFVAGFSERFAHDAVSTVGDRLDEPSGSPTTTV